MLAGMCSLPGHQVLSQNQSHSESCRKTAVPISRNRRYTVYRVVRGGGHRTNHPLIASPAAPTSGYRSIQLPERMDSFGTTRVRAISAENTAVPISRNRCVREGFTGTGGWHRTNHPVITSPAAPTSGYRFIQLPERMDTFGTARVRAISAGKTGTDFGSVVPERGYSYYCALFGRTA